MGAVPSLRVVELVALAYFASFAVAALMVPLPRGARVRTWAQLVAIAAAVWLMARPAAPSVVQVARDWAPGLLLVLGYWLPRDFVRGPHVALERWLVDGDAWFFRTRAGATLRRLPRGLQEYLELTYLLVYPMVPAGFAALVAAGRASEADRFWTMVLLAEFACYALLPLLPTRPPRVLEPHEAVPTRASRVRVASLWFMNTASNGWNTFPSGHVAGCLAVAFAVIPVLPAVGATLLLLALSITVATVAGRYHFAADAGAGALVAVAVALVV
jgi:hypothetical protein